MNTITELWNGNLKPVKTLGKNNEEIKHLEKLMQQNLNKLETVLNTNEKETFEKYNDCIEEYLTICCEQAFCDGFSLGVKIISESFAEVEKTILLSNQF